MIQVTKELIRVGRPRELNGTGGAKFHCLHADEADTALAVAEGCRSLWISLHTTLQLDLPEGSLDLGPRCFHYGPGDVPICAASRDAGTWMVLLLPPDALCSGTNRKNDPEIYPYPVLSQPLTVRVWRSAAAIWRAANAAPMSSWRSQQLIASLLSAIVASQKDLDGILSRCPGKSQAQKRQVLHRLIRVRNRVTLSNACPMSVVQMAELAHYSSSHFTRVFEHVFGESPHQFIVGTRMRKAEELLRRPHLAITEIADRLGFSSGATFARVFKSYYQESASVIRSRLSRRDPPTGRKGVDVGPRVLAVG